MLENNSLRLMNLKKIKDHMRRNGEVSKSIIARDTNLSFPTVTRLLEELCATGEILKVGQGNSTGGRCAAVYRMNYSFSLCLLIQIEGDIIKYDIKDLNNNIIEANQLKFENELLNILDQLIIEIKKRYPKLKVVVIGIAAMVSNGRVEESVGFPELRGSNISSHFKNLTEIPVIIENDMNLVMMGQCHAGKTPMVSTVGIYLGKQGFGAGMVINGQLWKGSSDFAGELIFLPFIPQKKIISENDVDIVDMIVYYTNLIIMYTVTINPQQIVLYDNNYIHGKLDEIHKQCYTYLPIEVIPYIEVSDNFQGTYEKGLYELAQRLIWGDSI